MDLRAAVALSLVEGVNRSRVAACLREATARSGRTSILPRSWPRRSAGSALPGDFLAEADRRAGEALDDGPTGRPRRPSGGRTRATRGSWPRSTIPRRSCGCGATRPPWWRRPWPWSARRAASAAAIETARTLAADLARRGVAVVSGLARGVDSAAHKGALDGGGVTVAVLGSGADRVYPPEHDGLARDIAVRGAVVSELAPGAPPLPEHFPARNRIISGLARAVVVVQAAERSGSLITARCALEQGRDVMAVPGLVLSGRNHGAHALIKDGAKLIETVDDILEELPGLGRPDAAPGEPGKCLIGTRVVRRDAGRGALHAR